jgi:hypothetical protein
MTLNEEKELWETLVNHGAWKLLQEIATEQMSGRIDQVVLTPLKSMDEALMTEFMKGEVAAIRLFLKMPELQIEQLTQDIINLKKENENGES